MRLSVEFLTVARSLVGQEQDRNMSGKCTDSSSDVELRFHLSASGMVYIIAMNRVITLCTLGLLVDHRLLLHHPHVLLHQPVTHMHHL